VLNDVQEYKAQSQVFIREVVVKDFDRYNSEEYFKILFGVLIIDCALLP
jgi:hypothetical protein